MAKAKPKTPETATPAIPLQIADELKAIGQTYADALSVLRNMFRSLLKAEDRLKELGAPVPDAIALYARVYTIHEKIEEVSKHTEALKQAFGRKIVPEAMDNAQTTNLTIVEGHRVTRVGDKVFASIPAPKRAETYAWLRANEAGDIIAETVNASTLSAWAKSWLEENKELPEGLFTVVTVPAVSLTRAKGWKLEEAV